MVSASIDRHARMYILDDAWIHHVLPLAGFSQLLFLMLLAVAGGARLCHLLLRVRARGAGGGLALLVLQCQWRPAPPAGLDGSWITGCCMLLDDAACPVDACRPQMKSLDGLIWLTVSVR